MSAAMEAGAAAEQAWPTLAPIRTSSSGYSSRVSCETLTRIKSTGAGSPPAPSSRSGGTPLERAHPIPGSASPKSAGSSPPPSATSSRLLSSCFPHRKQQQQRRRPPRPSAAASPSSAPSPWTSHSSPRGRRHKSPSSAIPHHQYSPSSNPKPPHLGPFSSQGSVSPSASRALLQKPGASIAPSLSMLTNSGTLLRSSRNHASSFTIIPPEMLRKQTQPADRYDDHPPEPTSPEVTCIGRVRRRPRYKVRWGAILAITDVHPGRKGKAARSPADAPRGGVSRQASSKRKPADVHAGLVSLDSADRQKTMAESSDDELVSRELQDAAEKLHLVLPASRRRQPGSRSSTELQKTMETLHLDYAVIRAPLHDSPSVVQDWDVEGLLSPPQDRKAAELPRQSWARAHAKGDLRSPFSDPAPSLEVPPDLSPPRQPNSSHVDSSSPPSNVGPPGSSPADFAPRTPPPNCLLLMRSSGGRHRDGLAHALPISDTD